MFWISNPTFWTGMCTVVWLVTNVVFCFDYAGEFTDRAGVVILCILEIACCCMRFIALRFRRSHYAMVAGASNWNHGGHALSSRRHGTSNFDLYCDSILFAGVVTLLSAIFFMIYHYGHAWNSLTITMPHTMLGIFTVVVGLSAVIEVVSTNCTLM